MYLSPENIERGIFERVRVVAVNLGFWVDETIIQTPQQLQQAINSLTSTPNAVAIEIIGIGDYQARGEKPKNCILIDFDSGGSGEVGGVGRVTYEKIIGVTPQDYKVWGIPSQTENLNFSLRLIAENTKNRRLAEKIIRASLPRKAYILGISEDGTSTKNGFWCFGGNYQDVSEGNKYGIERIFSYTVSNVFLEEPKDLGTVKPLLEVNLTTQIEDLTGIK